MCNICLYMIAKNVNLQNIIGLIYIMIDIYIIYNII